MTAPRPDPIEQSPSGAMIPRPPLDVFIAAARCNDDLRELFHTYRDEWTDDLTAAAALHCELLAFTQGTRAARVGTELADMVNALTPTEAFWEGVAYAVKFDELLRTQPTPAARRALAHGYVTEAGATA